MGKHRAPLWEDRAEPPREDARARTVTPHSGIRTVPAGLPVAAQGAPSAGLPSRAPSGPSAPPVGYSAVPAAVPSAPSPGYPVVPAPEHEVRPPAPGRLSRPVFDRVTGRLVPPSSRAEARTRAIAAAAAVVFVLTAILGAVRLFTGPDEPSTTATVPGASASGPAADPPLPTAAPGAAGTTAPTRTAKPRVGVFRGTSVTDVRAFERWSGQKVDYVLDYSSRGTWGEIENPGYMLREWSGSGYRMVYGVAMLPSNGGGTMEAGARGAYDQRFRRLAQRLVAAGQGNAILRVGWEFNVSSSRWRTENPRAYIRYYRSIVEAMRSVKGQRFQFDWTVNIGDSDIDGPSYYPGDDVVDYVGVDAYDLSWADGSYPYPARCDADCRLERQEIAWTSLYAGRRGLAFWADFAHAKGKPMSLPEWGLWKRPDGHGGGDNPYYIRRMHEFIHDPANNVAYHAYFEYDAAEFGTHRLTDLPRGGAEYRRLFGKK